MRVQIHCRLVVARIDPATGSYRASACDARRLLACPGNVGADSLTGTFDLLNQVSIVKVLFNHAELVQAELRSC